MVYNLDGEKRFYKTTMPDNIPTGTVAGTFITTHAEARESAKKAIAAGKARRYYIVKIIEVLELEPPPVSITTYRPKE